MTEQNAYLNLLEESFPGLKSNIIRCNTVGFPWESKPFFKEAKGKILSHVGFLEYPLLIEGRWHKTGALHAICTKASHRGQGLSSELIQEVLKWAQKEYEFVILFSKIPSFYEKLSFQNVQEYRFHLSCKRPKGSQSLIPLSTPKDNPLFLDCFGNRAPLSNHVWVKDNGTIAPFHTLFATYPTFWSLYYSPSLNGLISYVIEDKTLHLYDIITSKIPSLELILDHLPAPIDDIYFYFSPDRLTDAASAEPYLYDKDHLLIHGNWPRVKPFMISPLSRC